MTPNENVRTFVSLLLFIHLFCVVAALSAGFSPSGLQTDLAAKLAPYTKTLHLGGHFVPFHLTDGEGGLTRLHQWQVQELLATGDEGKILHRFPGPQRSGGFSHHRQDSYARLAGFYATNEAVDDDVCAAMAKSLARYTLDGSDTKSDRLVVRCVRYLSAGDIRSATAEHESVSVLYEADAWITEDGSLHVLKRMEPRRTAPVVESEPK